MSASPPKEPDVEQNAAQSPNNGEPPMDPSDPHGPSLGYEFEVKEQDRWLPIANVARIMKLALPENAKIAKEAKECMQECVSEFISFITSEASEKCHQEKRKTVNGEDILFAMTSLGFENYAEALKIYLAKYREVCNNLKADERRSITEAAMERESSLRSLVGKDEKLMTTQSQSARSENQQRPASQGFHGREGGSSSAPNPATGGNFDVPQGSNNNLLGNQQAEGGDHDPTGGFGALYESGLPGGQNGSAGGGGY